MTDTKDQKDKKTLSLSNKLSLKKTVDAGQIRQSFSHGRSKSVSVEVKKKRVIHPTSADKASEVAHAQKTSAELEARKRALEEALKSSAQSQAQLEETRRRREELEAEQKALIEEERKRQEELERLEEEKRRKEEEQKQTKQAPSEKKTSPEDVVMGEAPISDKPDTSKPKKTYVKPLSEEEEEKAAAKGAVKKTLTLDKRADTRHRLHSLTMDDLRTDDDEVAERKLYGRSHRSKPKIKKQKHEMDTRAVQREVIIPETITVGELANRMAVRGVEVIKKLMEMGVMATLTQSIDADTAELIVSDFGHSYKRVSDSDVEEGLKGPADAPENLKPRPPVVTVMGHVDHGKTSLLDAIRKTDVVSGEAGGITQHIGAYQVTMPSGAKISFIDTPGHAAFTEMRARGATVTDIVILVVAADDGIKDQTVEAISHTKAANVPMIVAINKIDKPDANPDRVRHDLLKHEVVLEELGGDVMAVEVSAKQGTNIDKLEETILALAEVLDLKANPDRRASGVVIESKLDKGRGAVATVLIQQGSLNVGDVFVTGKEWGRVRALVTERGHTLTEALPSQPVEVLGLNGVPNPGEDFIVVEDEAKAREVAEFRIRRERDLAAAKLKKTSIEDLLKQSAQGDKKELALVVKGDVQGSIEAIIGSLEKLKTDEVSVRVLHSGVGAITESDISLAGASGGLVLGFNVRANPQARDLAQKNNTEIRYYSIIYDVLDDMKAILGGLLSPDLREKYLGKAEIRQVFNITKVGKVAGCYITEGIVKRGAKVRLLRDNVVIHEGTLKTLKRVKDEVKEVKEGFECGMAFESYQDIREGDFIECFEIEEIARTLD